MSTALAKFVCNTNADARSVCVRWASCGLYCAKIHIDGLHTEADRQTVTDSEWQTDRQTAVFDYYAPPLIGGDIKRWCSLTSLCLTSVVTRTLCSPRVGASGGCSGGVGTCWPWETAATLPSARRRKALRRPRGRKGAGAYCVGRPPYSFFTGG